MLTLTEYRDLIDIDLPFDPTTVGEPGASDGLVRAVVAMLADDPAVTRAVRAESAYVCWVLSGRPSMTGALSQPQRWVSP